MIDFRTSEYPRPYPNSAPLALDRPEIVFLDGSFDQQAKNDFRTPEYPRPYPDSAPLALDRPEIIFLDGGFDQQAKNDFRTPDYSFKYKMRIAEKPGLNCRPSLCPRGGQKH